MAYFEPDWKRTNKKNDKKRKRKEDPWCGMRASVFVRQQLLCKVQASMSDTSMANKIHDH
jgi:hypothetical protein